MPLAEDGLGMAITDQRPQVVIIETDIETEIVIEIDAAMVIVIEINLVAEARVETDVNILHRPSHTDALAARTKMLPATVRRLNSTNALTERRKRKKEVRYSQRR